MHGLLSAIDEVEQVLLVSLVLDLPYVVAR